MSARDYIASLLLLFDPLPKLFACAPSPFASRERRAREAGTDDYES